MESFEADESNFKERILHLLTDEPKQEKVYRQTIDKDQALNFEYAGGVVARLCTTKVMIMN